MMKFLLIGSLFFISFQGHTSAVYKSLFLSVEHFNSLSEKSKKEYLKSVRENYLEFELAHNQKLSFAINNFQFRNIFLFEETANAQSASCMVGGAEVPKVGTVCTLKQNACTTDKVKSGFKCGEIYGSTCISKTPVDSISSRCAEEMVWTKDEDYQKMKSKYEAMYDKLCVKEKNPNLNACPRFKSRMSMLSLKTLKTDVVIPAQVPPISTDVRKVEGDSTARRIWDENQCDAYIAEIKNRLAPSFDETKGKETVAAAYLDGLEIWNKYLALKEKCKTDKCKQILDSQVMDAEMNPKRVSSTTEIGNGIADDMKALGGALGISSVAAVKKVKPSAEQLDDLIRVLGWNPKGGYARSLVNAYLTDETFTNGNSSKRSLVNMTINMGDGRLRAKDERPDGYTQWLLNGDKELTRESKRIQEVFIKPFDRSEYVQRAWEERYGKNLSPEEMATAIEMKALIDESIKVTYRMRVGVAELRMNLFILRDVPSICFSGPDAGLFKYIVDLSKYANKKQTGSVAPSLPATQSGGATQ